MKEQLKELQSQLEQLKTIVESGHLKDILTDKEAAKLLDVTRPTLLRWRKKGIVKGYALGGRIYYKRSELLAGLEVLN